MLNSRVRSCLNREFNHKECHEITHKIPRGKRTHIKFPGLLLAVFFFLNIIFFYFVLRMISSMLTRYSQQKKSSSLCVSLDIYDGSANDMCDSDMSYEAIVLVNSAVGNHERRMAIRKTWGDETFYASINVPVRVLFILGSEKIHDNELRLLVEREQMTYNDIMWVKVTDSYRNNIFKHMFGLHYVTKKCNHAHLIIKTDDDIFVQVEKVIHNYHHLAQASGALYCNILQANPIRDPENKWFLDEKVYTQTFPYYCMGSFYALSMKSAEALVDVMQCYPYLWIDDVHVTGIIRKEAKIPLVGMDHSTQVVINTELPIALFTNWVTNGRIRTVYHHKVTPKMMEILWNVLRAREQAFIGSPITS